MPKPSRGAEQVEVRDMPSRLFPFIPEGAAQSDLVSREISPAAGDRRGEELIPAELLARVAGLEHAGANPRGVAEPLPKRDHCGLGHIEFRVEVHPVE
jgi:hypothetical protein